MNEDQLFDLFYQNREKCPYHQESYCKLIEDSCMDHLCPIFFWIKLFAQEISE